MLCRYAIITDTVNFSDTAKKTTKTDIHVIKRLESYLKMETEKRNIDYQSILEAKQSIQNLTVEQCLRKDLKVRIVTNLLI